MGLLLTAEELFQIAAQMEAAGQSYYLELADVTSDSRLKEIYTNLAEEEEKHYKLFIEYYQTATHRKWELARLDDETVDYIQALLNTRMFPKDSDIAGIVAAIKSPREALTKALSFEKDSLLFFRELLDVAGTELCPALSTLIKDEREHIATLQTQLEATP